MAKKLTPWFPPEVKPVHVGPYETYWPGDFQHWNGKFWGLISTSPREAKQCESCKSVSQDMPWRGLANPPKGTK